MYLLTVYFPLRIKELHTGFLALFTRREYINTVSRKLFKGKAFMGILPDGNLLFYPLDDSKILPIISEIYQENIYDVKQMEDFKMVCDIGAHIGLFTLKISKQAPKSKIIALEPDPTNFKFLVRNLSINGLTNRTNVLNVAAGEKKKKALLFTNRESRGDSSMKKWHNAWTTEYSTIAVIPLADTLSTELGCDLMKIDVEGMESEVLNGLEDQYPKLNRLVVEIHTCVVHAADIYEWLRNHNFLITRAQELYEDCILVEAQRPCI
jgi:FkbM family methyltransferase